MTGLTTSQPAPGRRIAVTFLTEGTYPYYGGGVSTWSDLLLTGLSDVDFHIVATTAQPCAATRYSVPANARSLAQIPMWGAGPADAVRLGVGLRALIRQRANTGDRQIASHFVPAFRTWLRCVFGEPAEQDWSACGMAIAEMARFLRSADYDAIFRSAQVWEAYTAAIAEWYRPAPASVAAAPEPSLADIGATLSWMAALLRPLAATLPRADVYHATVAATVGLLGVVARLEHGTPFLLTEHGVYFRERTISAAADAHLSFFQKQFLVRLAEAVAHVCYAYAGLIAPVCRFNSKWEIRLGAPPEKIRVIYNAVDTGRFAPGAKPATTAERPTVVVMASVMPIKDIVTLIRAAALVRARIPDVCFTVYGSLTADPRYVERCRELIGVLGLETTVYLAGHHPRPEQVYLEGDITALSSISEAFPFTVLESMACGRPVVATDVGGVAEAVGDIGIVVPPRSPAELANAILSLLGDPARCRELSAKSRERALERFQIQHFLAAYTQAYQELASSSDIIA